MPKKKPPEKRFCKSCDNIVLANARTATCQWCDKKTDPLPLVIKYGKLGLAR